MVLRITASLFVLGLFAMAPAHGAEISNSDIAACAALEGDIERLDCYDGLAAEIQTGISTKAGLALNGWSITEEASLVEKGKDVFMSVDSNETISDGAGGRERPTLWIRCKDGTTSVYVVWDIFLGIDRTSMLHQIDEDTAQGGIWEISRNYKTVGKWSERKSVPFIKSLFGGTKLLTEIVPHDEQAIQVTFDIDGLESAIQPLRQACEW